MVSVVVSMTVDCGVMVSVVVSRAVYCGVMVSVVVSATVLETTTLKIFYYIS
jgi:hypothetical protein